MVWLAVAIVLIIGRSAYRTVEFSEGIFSPLGKNEVLFVILDGFPIAIATSLLVIFHPFRMLPSTSGAFKSADQELRFMPEEDTRC